MTTLIILIIAVVVGFVFLKKYFPEVLSKNKKNKSFYSYKRKDFLISRPEHEFFDILVEILGNQYYVFPQIHLSNILDNKIVGQNWKGAFRHIDEKSVDYVICDKAYIKPLLAIELDDRTHEQENRRKRDIEVNRILDNAGIPFMRFENHGSFDKEKIKKLISEKINL